MRPPTKIYLGVALAGLVALGLVNIRPAAAQVVPQVFQGTFTKDDDQALFTFAVTTAGTVSFYTTSYAGGTNVDNSVTGPGGFDTYLSLFDSSGALIFTNDDNINAETDPTTGNARDAGIDQFLDAGTYQLVITQSDNVPIGPNLSDGFSHDGQSTFTQNNVPPGGTATAPFVDADGNQRNGNYTVNIDNGPLPVAVPEVSSFASFGLMLLGGAGAFLKVRKRKALTA